MKNFKLLFTSLALLLFGFGNAQKVGIVDTNYILNMMPQYKEAEARLNSQIDTWEQDLQRLQAELDKKRSAFENEKVLLVGDQLKLREKEVMDLKRSPLRWLGK